MTITTISSREFDQDVSRAKRAAETCPVVITNRNEPAYVLLRHDDYRQLPGDAPSIRQLLAQPGAEEGGAADFDFDPLIAAIAQVHRLRVVTRNVANLAPMQVDLLNPKN